MATPVKLPHYLAEYRKQVCSRCWQENPNGPPPAAFVEDGFPEARRSGYLEAVPVAHQPAVRRRMEGHAPGLCEKCDFLLVLHAIQDMIPVADFPAWLKQSNLDLDGRTPAECIDAADYDAVFRALWFVADSGPVS